ncbi:MAG: hypothetical protein P1U56_10865 [Saprospiraceae bacterium]|nr:hypothetical protein [Saprospiraceae bacterium]
MMRSLLWGLMLLFCCVANAQISVSVTANADSIKFGDEVDLAFKINVPQGVDVTLLDFASIKETANLIYSSYPEEVDSLMDIDIIDGGVFNINNSNLVAVKKDANSILPMEGTIRIRISSIGALFLPQPIVGHLSGVETLPLETPLLFVKPHETGENLNPNWDILLEAKGWQDYLFYLYVILGMAVFVVAIYMGLKYLKKDKEVEEEKEVEIVLPADVIARKELMSLKEKELWQNGDTKGYHTELTRIMRQYIEGRYHIQALEMTSSQLKREMNAQQITQDIVKRFDDILQIADKVKFAKGDAGPELNIKFMDESMQIVEETKEVKTENSEAE